MEAIPVESDNPDIFVHAWEAGPDESGYLGGPKEFFQTYIPMSYVKKRGKSLEMTEGSSPGWKILQFSEPGYPTRIKIMGNLKADEMRAVAVYVLEFEDMLAREIGSAPQNIPYTIKIYSSHADFLRFANSHGAGNAMSFYAPRSNEIGMWFDETLTHEQLQDLIAHELTHAYMDIVWRTTSPLWFAEGMAEYFQHFSWKRDHAIPGALNKHEIENLRGAPLVPIEEFIQLPRGRMYGPEFKMLYAQAWSVVHFLFEYEPEMIRELLERRKIDVSGLDGEWEGHLRAMMKMSA